MITAVFTRSLLEALRKGSTCSSLPSWKEANIWLFRLLYYYTVVVQSLSHIWLFETQWTAARQASLSFTISWSLLKLTSIELVIPSDHLILCCPFLLLPSILPSIRVFSNKSALHIPLGLTGLISLLTKGLSRVFSSTRVWRHLFFGAQSFHISWSILFPRWVAVTIILSPGLIKKGKSLMLGELLAQV